MANEMIERVARAICCPHGCAAIHEPTGPETCTALTNRDEDWVKRAIAVIIAMTDPTDAMVEAAHNGDFDIYWGYYADGRPGGAVDVFRAMITAALEGNHG